VIPRGDGDGWTYCAQGHKHWGIYGAAGLLLWHDDRVLLQHRALWSHHGGTWGILGGARNSGETAVHTAAREAAEEAGFGPERYEVVGEHVDDHGGWSYTTVLADLVADVVLVAQAESQELRWVRSSAVDALPLHPGFAKTWPLLRQRVRSGR